MSQSMNRRKLVRLMRQAQQGNRQAALRLIDWALPQVSGKFDDLMKEVEYHRTHTWDTEGARAMAMNPEMEVPPDHVIGAFQEIHRQILKVTALTPVLLMADDDEREDFEDAWEQQAYDLFIMLFNPSYKYAIIGGLNPEVREEVEDYWERMGRELIGTMDALMSEDVDFDEFPPETSDIIESTAATVEARNE